MAEQQQQAVKGRPLLLITSAPVNSVELVALMGRQQRQEAEAHMHDPNRRGSICGVTMNNNWLYNNPDLRYPEGHEQMDEAELREALKADPFDGCIMDKPEPITSFRKGQQLDWVHGDCYRQAKVLKVEKDRVLLAGLSSEYWMKKSTLLRKVNAPEPQPLSGFGCMG